MNQVHIPPANYCSYFSFSIASPLMKCKTLKSQGWDFCVFLGFPVQLTVGSVSIMPETELSNTLQGLRELILKSLR